VQINLGENADRFIDHGERLRVIHGAALKSFRTSSQTCAGGHAF
jgi:hypothetical protein